MEKDFKDIANELDELEYIGEGSDFEMPKWMDCVWRRKACGKDECKICGKIKKDRQKHIERGEDPDSMESVFEDVGENFKETMQMIKRDAERMGIDITNVENIQEPPGPESFPLYWRVRKWHKSVFDFVEEAVDAEKIWIQTELIEDLTWYANILSAKTYRQLCNKWHMNNGDEYGEFDYKYTEYVLGECFAILDQTFSHLMAFDTNVAILYAELINLKESVLKI